MLMQVEPDVVRNPYNCHNSEGMKVAHHALPVAEIAMTIGHWLLRTRTRIMELPDAILSFHYLTPPGLVAHLL